MVETYKFDSAAADATKSTNNDVSVTVQVTPQERAAVPEGQKRQEVGAGVGAGLLGLALGGPVVAVAAGFGAAAATKVDGKVGNFARDAGEQVATMGEKLKEWDSKNGRVVERVQNLNEKHSIKERVADPVAKGYNYLRKGPDSQQPRT